MDAAYKLFSERGVGAVGVDAIVCESGCAKSSLYNNFKSKEDLALAFLDEREKLWSKCWFEEAIRCTASTPEGRLIAIFDVLDGWFRSPGFEGCSFMNVMLESPKGSAVRVAAAQHLENSRRMVRSLAEQAGLAEPDAFSQVWHMLIKGAIVSAGEGHCTAAIEARRAAHMVLRSWARCS
ncbi:MAG: helix-turn-helix transcriptional regulator [Halioglobus sp.]|nr:helix-turn-helix transcriptional regulator [Halioglobus sp.]